MKLGAGLIYSLVALSPAVFAADRVEVVAMFGGERVPDARACFSAEVVVPRGPRVIDALASGPETRCLPADKVLSVPAGIWHMYVVSDDPFLVSMHPFVFHRSRGSTDEENVSRLVSDLLPAAMLSVEMAAKALGPGESLAVYVTHEGSEASPPALVPVSPGETEIPVPARTPVVPLIMRGTDIVAVGERVAIAIGGRADAKFPQEDGATIVVPFRLPHGGEVAEFPAIVLFHRRLNKIVTTYKPTATNWKGLLFARGVSAGKVAVLVDSEAIVARPVDVSVNARDRVITIPDVVMRVADVKAAIAWSIDGQFADAVRNAHRCGGETAAQSPSLRLYACEPGKQVSRPRHLDGCTLLRDAVLPTKESGAVRWPIPSDVGETFAELTYGGISAFERVNLIRGDPAASRITLAPRYITGRVTYRDEAVAAEVGCGGGVQATDTTGYYRCWRSAESPPVVVAALCDGSGSYRQTYKDEATVVDIRIATNTLQVRVVDAATSEAIPEAYVSLWEGSPYLMPEPDTTLLGPTDESGMVRTSRLEPREVSVCADKKGFVRACEEQVIIEHDADTAVKLALRQESLLDGRIMAPTAIIDGRLYVTVGARQLAEVVVEKDGAFALAIPPPPDAAFILVSRSLPLCVLGVAPSKDGLINLAVPGLRPKTFVITSGTRTPVTLELGGVLLPSNAFARHQFLRNEQYVVWPGRPMTVEAVDSSVGVTVVAGAVALTGAPLVNPATLGRYPVGDRLTVELP
jgi:hypothetical protein